MKISLKSAITLLLAISIATGILLYPARVSCTSIQKFTDPTYEPNIRAAEPGYDPGINTRTLGSSQGTGIDTKQPDLPQDDNRETRTTRSRYMQLLSFYLRNFTHGSFRY